MTIFENIDDKLKDTGLGTAVATVAGKISGAGQSLSGLIDNPLANMDAFLKGLSDVSLPNVDVTSGLSASLGALGKAIPSDLSGVTGGLIGPGQAGRRDGCRGGGQAPEVQGWNSSAPRPDQDGLLGAGGEEQWRRQKWSCWFRRGQWGVRNGSHWGGPSPAAAPGSGQTAQRHTGTDWPLRRAGLSGVSPPTTRGAAARTGPRAPAAVPRRPA